MQLCREDPLLKLVYEKYRAHPIRVPEARIKPLSVFFKVKGDRIAWIGPIARMVDEATQRRLRGLRKYSGPMADVSAERSSEVGISAGLGILGGLLDAFGAAGCLPAIDAQFKRVEKVSFQFHNVERLGYEPADITKRLPSQPFLTDNELVKTWLDRSRRPTGFIVDSILTSGSFSIKVGESSQANVKVSHVPVAAALDASARLNVSGSQGSTLHFQAKEVQGKQSQKLAFALTCLRLIVTRRDGGIVWEPYVDSAAFLRPGEKVTSNVNALLSDTPVLLDL
jgi:hypothetical protein